MDEQGFSNEDTAVIVVDLQADFTEAKSGTLAVPGTDVQYIKAVEKIKEDYTSLAKGVKNHILNIFNEKSQSNSLNGVKLTLHVDNKTPIIGDSINLTIKITNSFIGFLLLPKVSA